VRWVPLAQLDRFAFPEANAQIIAALQRRFQAESDAPAA
jgi:hypothetical protein